MERKSITKNGLSITTKPGEENYCRYEWRGREYVQYDYREPITGELFATVRPTLEQCRADRDAWIRRTVNGKMD